MAEEEALCTAVRNELRRLHAELLQALQEKLDELWRRQQEARARPPPTLLSWLPDKADAGEVLPLQSRLAPPGRSPRTTSPALSGGSGQDSSGPTLQAPGQLPGQMESDEPEVMRPVATLPYGGTSGARPMLSWGTAEDNVAPALQIPGQADVEEGTPIRPASSAAAIPGGPPGGSPPHLGRGGSAGSIERAEFRRQLSRKATSKSGFMPLRNPSVGEYLQKLDGMDAEVDQGIPCRPHGKARKDSLLRRKFGLSVEQHYGESHGDPEMQGIVSSTPSSRDGRPTFGRLTKDRSSKTEHALGVGFSRGKTAGLDEASPLQKMALRIVRSLPFETWSLSMLVIASVLNGAQTDYMAMATNIQEESPVFFRVVDLIIFVLFAFETAFRAFAYRRRFFNMWGWGWNLLDVVLVSCQFFEEMFLVWNRAWTSRSSLAPTGLLRTARVLRAVRLLRIFNVVRFAEELRLFASCLLHAASSFAWSFAAVLMMVYVVAVFLTHMTSIALSNSLAAGQQNEAVTQLVKWYGRVPRSVLSLIQGLTGGVDWNELVMPLVDGISPWLGVVFVLYTAFAILVVMNVVSAMFVQQAMEHGKEVQEMQRVRQASRLFKRLDEDQSGLITFMEVEAHLETTEVRSFFKSINVEVTDARVLFDLMDMDGSGALDFEEFLDGCMRLQSPAKALDLVLLMKELEDVLDEACVASAGGGRLARSSLSRQPTV
uniref:EF-hand domain-containing protein n=1 Tax=Alexandrium monilatum TaxID=311494 RepID=A0A7S4QPG4_9DINO